MILLVVIFIGLGLLLTEKLWVPKLVAWILEREGTQVDAELPAAGEIRVRIGQSEGALGVRVVPLEVVQDSRCPIGVQCVWAGTVVLRAMLESGLGKAEQQFELGKPITTEAEEVTLVRVRPERSEGNNIATRDYIFDFQVNKR